MTRLPSPYPHQVVADWIAANDVHVLTDSVERRPRDIRRVEVPSPLDYDVCARRARKMQAEAIAVAPGPRPFEDEAVLRQVREAIVSLRRLAFAYMGGSTPGRMREVSPLGLLFGRSNYLVAAEGEAGAPRTWRLDRLAEVRVLAAPATPPAGFSLAAFVDRSFGIYQDEVEDVRLRIRPHGAEEALGWRFHSTQQATPLPDGSVLVAFRASGMRELAWHLFSWGDKVEILGPQRLKDMMAEQLSLALRAHRA